MILDTKVSIRDILRKSLQEINVKLVSLAEEVKNVPIDRPHELLNSILEVQVYTSKASSLVVVLDSHLGGKKGAHVLLKSVMEDIPEYVAFEKNIAIFGKAIADRKASVIAEIAALEGRPLDSSNVIDIFNKTHYNISSETLQ